MVVAAAGLSHGLLLSSRVMLAVFLFQLLNQHHAFGLAASQVRCAGFSLVGGYLLAYTRGELLLGPVPVQSAGERYSRRACRGTP